MESKMALIQHFQFLRPLWLLLLPVWWGLSIWLARRHATQGGWTQLIDSALLPSLRLAGGGKSGGSPWPWLALAWTLATVALAGPSWQQVSSAAFRGNSTWLLVLDLSPSMSASDVSPDRVTRARYALDDLLEAAQDTRVGLVAYSDESYTVTPITDDVATIRTLLPSLTPGIMPSAGDNLAPALVQAGNLLQQGGVKNAQIVVLTDGFSDPTAAFPIAKKLQSQGIAINVVGIGTQAGAPVSQQAGGFAQNGQGGLQLNQLNVAQLQQLATTGGGSYANLAQLPDLIQALKNRADHSRVATENKEMRLEHRLDGGIWILPLLLLVAALLARRGWL
jgi:Ca-activated chloride channel family protein